MDRRTIMTPVPYTDINSEIMHSVIGQLSDGIWENSKVAEKVWRGLGLIIQNGYIVITTDSRSTLHYKSDDEVRSYFASKIKQIVKKEIENGSTELFWDRYCDRSSTYLNYQHDVQVRDAYLVYDLLKGRTIKQDVPQPIHASHLQVGDKVEKFGRVVDLQEVVLGGKRYMVGLFSYGSVKVLDKDACVRVQKS